MKSIPTVLRSHPKRALGIGMLVAAVAFAATATAASAASAAAAANFVTILSEGTTPTCWVDLVRPWNPWNPTGWTGPGSDHNEELAAGEQTPGFDEVQLERRAQATFAACSLSGH